MTGSISKKGWSYSLDWNRKLLPALKTVSPSSWTTNSGHMVVKLHPPSPSKVTPKWTDCSGLMFKNCNHVLKNQQDVKILWNCSSCKAVVVVFLKVLHRCFIFFPCTEEKMLNADFYRRAGDIYHYCCTFLKRVCTNWWGHVTLVTSQWWSRWRVITATDVFSLGYLHDYY